MKANKNMKDNKPKGVKNRCINTVIKTNLMKLEKSRKIEKPNKFINTNKLININKNKSTSKEKNINVIFINIKNYINEKNFKKHNGRYLESSVSNQKYKSTYNYRELSESVKNKFLNKKTRFMRIPWKIIKKSIDERMKLDELYKAYIIKSKNPFNYNDTKINKISNIKPIQHNQKKNIL